MEITIIGMGLIGTSMGRRLRQAGNFVTAVESNAINANEALSLGGCDRVEDFERGLSSTQLVIVAVPVDIALEMIPSILNRVADGVVVMDVGSTKEEICKLILDHPNRGAFVAAHPMAGRAIGGAHNSDPSMFQGSKFIICDSNMSDSYALELVCSVAETLGAHTMFSDSQLHDKMVALTSHLPQLLSFAYTQVPSFSNLISFRFAGSGYMSISRLATSQGRVWIPIFKQNRDEILVQLHDMRSELDKMIEGFENNDFRIIEKIIESANRNRCTYERIINHYEDYKNFN